MIYTVEVASYILMLSSIQYVVLHAEWDLSSPHVWYAPLLTTPSSSSLHPVSVSAYSSIHPLPLSPLPACLSLVIPDNTLICAPQVRRGRLIARHQRERPCLMDAPAPLSLRRIPAIGIFESNFVFVYVIFRLRTSAPREVPLIMSLVLFVLAAVVNCWCSCCCGPLCKGEYTKSTLLLLLFCVKWWAKKYLMLFICIFIIGKCIAESGKSLQLWVTKLLFWLVTNCLLTLICVLGISLL